MKITQAVRDELEAIRGAHPEGRILASDVLARAQDEASALHEHFTWDDTEAAARFRLQQARQLIVAVRVLTPTASGGQVSVRAYVSLASDRLHGGGYRALQAVMSDDAFRDEMLRTAMAEAQAFTKRYRLLADELAPIFSAIESMKAA